MKNDAIDLFHVVRRDGQVTAFDPTKIRTAITNAFLKDEDGNPYSPSGELGAGQRDTIEQLTSQVVAALLRGRPGGGAIHIEDIQDAVELALMRLGEHRVARGYVLYRARHAAQRQQERSATPDVLGVDALQLTGADGTFVTMTGAEALQYVNRFEPGKGVDVPGLVTAAMRELFTGAPVGNFYRAIELAAKARMERHPDYDALAMRILLDTLNREVLGEGYAQSPELAATKFADYVRLGVEISRLDPRLAEFDLERIVRAINPARDLQFDYLGLGTLYDRYLIQHEKRRIETPQWLFMRVAMGLAINEVDRTERAIEFYEVLSSFRAMSSTPTLFNAGTVRPQLSSCYLTSIADNLDSIYGGIKDNAMLQKYAGGLGNDWSRVRALGAYIHGTNGESQGVIPFLKVVNDTAIAVNQGGKRKGAVCSYLETWHMDIEEFLDLRKNTGDDRRRTHDMNTANWIPDLFMQRVQEGGTWTLFSPDEVPQLHELYGQRFERAYVEAERRGQAGEIRSRTVPAVDLWRKMLTMLFETGHPWLTFKDPCNLRSPQQHCGVVHSSNLCTEITLNTSDDEIAVCNLASINLPAHVRSAERRQAKFDLPDILDLEKLEQTVTTTMRMLDNVVDLNLYSVDKARRSNLRHRPVGLGCMGFQDALHMLRLAWSDADAHTFADWAQQSISAYAIRASALLARERGRYSSYDGSLWSRGILPQDSVAMLEQERGSMLVVSYQGREHRIGGVEHPSLPWPEVRTLVERHGMRNSNCLAIAPTATISNIVGVDQSIEPMFGAISVKSNMAGEFTVVNTYLQALLEQLGVWDEVMVSDLKHFDGSVQKIERVPAAIRERFKTAFEVDPEAVIMLAAARQVWIDQAQSLNLYLANPNGKKLDAMYRLAWATGLKTTYYLRTTSASQVEKSTGRGGELNAVANVAAAQCSIDDPSCEACQ